MKKIFLTMVALLSMTAMMAQNENGNNGERKAPKQLTPEEMTEKMATDLSLTAEQKTKVLALQKEYQDVNRGPRMGGQRPPRPQADGQTGATQQRPERPQLTEEQRAEMQKYFFEKVLPGFSQYYGEDFMNQLLEEAKRIEQRGIVE